MSDDVDDFYDDFCAWVEESKGKNGSERRMTLEDWAKAYVRHLERLAETLQ